MASIQRSVKTPKTVGHEACSSGHRRIKIKAPYYRLEIALCFRSHRHIIDMTAASVTRVVACVYDYESQGRNCRNTVVNRETPHNLNEQGVAGGNMCSICKDLLANM